MSHQDPMDCIVTNWKAMKQAIDWLLPEKIFRKQETRSNAKWKQRMLAVTAFLWATSEQPTLTDRFEQARKIVRKIFRWNPEPGKTRQGFMKMLGKLHGQLMLAIVPHVRAQMKETLPGQWEIAGYVVFAGDGSRMELARTESLENAFSPKPKESKRKCKRGKASFATKAQKRKAAKKVATKRKAAKKQSAESIDKKRTSPQMWLTLLWHVGAGLPWDWRTGPSDSSERDHLQEMLPELPENSLITMDGGFVGYDFCRSILDAKRNFLIRVGGNVRLLRKLGYSRQYDHTVYLWPDSAAKKKQLPLVLRLIEIHDGKEPVYLLTNLTKSQLKDQQAAKIYAARWGIEVFFRTLKQTFGLRKLRSHSAKNARLEADWSLLSLWCICLSGQRELAVNGHLPHRLSAAKAIRAFQATIREYRVRPECFSESLWSQLRHATLDEYTRTSSKTSRNYPRQKQRKQPMAPKIEHATEQQIHTALELKRQQREFRLPA